MAKILRNVPFQVEVLIPIVDDLESCPGLDPKWHNREDDLLSIEVDLRKGSLAFDGDVLIHIRAIFIDIHWDRRLILPWLKRGKLELQ